MHQDRQGLAPVSDIKLVQVIVSVDGALCQVVIPQECKPVLLSLMQGLSTGGALKVVRLPSNVVQIPLSDAVDAGT